MARDAQKRKQSVGNTAPKNSKKNLNRIILISIVVLAVIGVAAFVFLPDLLTPPRVYPNAVENTIGDSSAAVKVEEFSDFQCPYCGQFALNQEPELIDKYVATGKVQFTYHPFSFLGAESVRAAEAAFCAMDQGKFWEYKETLFENQAGENLGGFSDDRLIAFASQTGLRVNDFRECFTNGAHTDRVQEEYQQGQERGVTATPMFFVNGKGPLDSRAVFTEIEAALGN